MVNGAIQESGIGGNDIKEYKCIKCDATVEVIGVAGRNLQFLCESCSKGKSLKARTV